MTVLQRLRRGLLRLIPAPRGPLLLRDLAPLLLFALIYGYVLWRFLDVRSFSLARPWLWTVAVVAGVAPMAWMQRPYWRTRRFWLALTGRAAVISFIAGFDLWIDGAIRTWGSFLRWITRLLRGVWDSLGWTPLLRRWSEWTETTRLEELTFTAPWNFLWLLTAVWVWWMWLQGWSGLNRRRGLQSLSIRLLLLGLFAMLLAEPRAVRTSDALSVVYAVDMSASIHPNQLSEAQKFITRTVSEKPEGDEAGLVIFGSNAAVELPPEKSFPFDERAPEGTIYFNSRIDRDATNLEHALSLSAAVLPETTRGRIVLISDGSETAGDLKSVLEQLKVRGIAVDVLPVTYNYEKEVWVERIELPQTVKIGESYTASVTISALQSGHAQLILEENGQPIRDEPFEIDFVEGKNRVDIPIFLRGPGYYEYRARIIPEEGSDGRPENNEAIGFIFVQGEGSVLVVVDPLRKNDQDFSQFVQVLKEEERLTTVIDAYELPRNSLSLLPYDCIVFANVPHDAFSDDQLQAVRDAVFNQGIGFLMVGGANSFGPGGYHRSVIEDTLPVTMDITKKKVMPKGALAIILHTCEFPEGNTWANRITKQAIKVLGREDEVGVLAYGAGEEWIFDLTPAGEYDRVAPLINAANIGDMPAFGPPMQMGLDALKNSDAATKHMIIISDGDPQPAPPAMLQDFVDSRISISTVAIFPHGGQEIGLLRTVAQSTGGRYYFPDDPSQLPSIFIKEAKTLKRNMIQEKQLQPQIGYPSSVLEGINGLPPLHGIVLTSLKENALTENALFAVTDESDPEETDPVLAIWRYGLGMSAAFTSSLSNAWAREWVSWEQYQAFVKQLMIRLSRVRRSGHLRMWTLHQGGEGVIMVEDFHPEETFLDVSAQVSGPANSKLSIPLRQVGPRRYRGAFPVTEKGRFQVTVTGRSGEREDLAHAGFIVSYSPEFLKFTSSWGTLREILEATGGVELSPASAASEIYNRRRPQRSSQPIFDLVLILLACLIPLDVAVRRVQLDWATVAERLGWRKRDDTTKTMGALLARKAEVGSQLRGQTGERPVPLPTGAPRAAPQRTAAPPSSRPAAPKEQPAAAAEDESTMSRLLRAKRQREEQ